MEGKQEATVVIPNWNGMKFLKDCLNSLQCQTRKDFSVILVDNGSEDGSVEFVKAHFPDVRVISLKNNTGFCHAVNTGIRGTKTPYVILLNNDVVCHERFVEELLEGISGKEKCFSCAARMMQLQNQELLDNGGDYYCALGWAFAAGKGKPVGHMFGRQRRIFSSCAGAAVYRRELLEQIGLFDEKHFAYLEDVDIGYRARIAGYENWYIPSAVVYHAGSGTTGSAHNSFKVRLASRNNVYLIYKNMPLFQIVINLPFLLAGFLIKTVFFAQKGLGSIYIKGVLEAAAMCDAKDKVKFRKENIGHYVQIQLELWLNTLRRIKCF